MNIEIVLEGKLKESYFKSGVLEFKKRLTGYCDLKITEVSNIDEYKKTLKKNDFVIALAIEGKSLSSEEFALKLREIENEGYYTKTVFLIGGAFGLSKKIKDEADFCFSMSKLTFLHQEACMILAEQIYRAVKILNKEPYHK